MLVSLRTATCFMVSSVPEAEVQKFKPVAVLGHVSKFNAKGGSALNANQQSSLIIELFFY